MATKTITELVSDLSGRPIERGRGRSVDFSYEGVLCRVDLTNDEVAAFEKSLAPYLEAARKVGIRRTSASSTTKRGFDPAAVRAWAVGQGITVSPRGRISADVVERYRAAGN
ncbi:Lsr2 family protein [Georgenia sp. M64]|uniref:histone-like nucleoid-structuring protein Lsr2 n=1 Tax=Georgenia sp. M64 TaxID=3120520 RepID=UPI0030E34495